MCQGLRNHFPTHVLINQMPTPCMCSILDPKAPKEHEIMVSTLVEPTIQ